VQQAIKEKRKHTKSGRERELKKVKEATGKRRAGQEEK